jgi:ubiquinone/menaquinone biosynthesis C-methylase UbiE
MRQGFSEEKIKSIYNKVSHRYDFQHGLVTANSDQGGRRLLVEKAVNPGNVVLDAGAGTGRTAFLAAQKVGSNGKVVLFDISEGMLEMAKQKAERFGVTNQVEFRTGDILHLPFPDNHFDVVLSTYSICPLYDPAGGALELYRVVKAGGLLGIAHSTEPENTIVKRIADWVEDIVWKIPSLSLGCRTVSVLPALVGARAKVIYEERIGIPLWPFIVFVIEKPVGKSSLSTTA